jgi:hypothetical protein
MLYQLSYTRSDRVYRSRTSRVPARLTTRHGGGRIRTYVGQSPADLQSATISHSVTPPSLPFTLSGDVPTRVTLI